MGKLGQKGRGSLRGSLRGCEAETYCSEYGLPGAGQKMRRIVEPATVSPTMTPCLRFTQLRVLSRL